MNTVYKVELWLREAIDTLDEKNTSFLELSTTETPRITDTLVIAGNWYIPLANIKAVNIETIENKASIE